VKKVGTSLVFFWTHHVQKTLGTILAGSALFDLMSSFDLYGPTLTSILGLKAYSTLRGLCAVLIMLRAVIRPAILPP